MGIFVSDLHSSSVFSTLYLSLGLVSGVFGRERARTPSPHFSAEV